MTTKKEDITVRVSTLDHHSESRHFVTIPGARAYAARWVGRSPEMGSTYAVSGDGVARVTVLGISLKELFAEPAPPPPTKCFCEDLYDEDTGRGDTCAYCKLPAVVAKRKAAKQKEDRRREVEMEKSRKFDQRNEEYFRKTGKTLPGWMPF